MVRRMYDLQEVEPLQEAELWYIPHFIDRMLKIK